MKTLQERLKDLRTDHDLSQREIANTLGITQQIYSAYETARSELPIRHLVRLAEYYQVNTEYLLGLTDYKYPLEELNKPFLENISFAGMTTLMVALKKQERRSAFDFLLFLNSKKNNT